jgi:hypothetical protein
MHRRVPMAWLRQRLWRVVMVLALTGSACSRQDARLEQHKQKFESLGETTAAICEAWLGGDVSGTYTRTALEQTFLLVEQERTALAASPETLLDARGAALSQSAERLSRLIATLIHDVQGADDASVRQRLTEIPIRPPAEQP